MLSNLYKKKSSNSEIGFGLRPHLIWAVLGIFFIQLFPNWTTCRPVVHILISIMWPHFLYLIMQLLNVFVSILSLIQNFILLPNIHAIELGIKVEKSISRTSPSLTLKQHFSFRFPQLQSLKWNWIAILHLLTNINKHKA